MDDNSNPFAFYESLADTNESVKPARKSRARPRSTIKGSCIIPEGAVSRSPSRMQQRSTIETATSELRKQSRMLRKSKLDVEPDGTFGQVSSITSPSRPSSPNRKSQSSRRVSSARLRSSKSRQSQSERCGIPLPTRDQNNLLDSIDNKATVFESKKQAVVLASKTLLTVVEGGACDFVAVRLSMPPRHPVLVEIVDKSGQVRTHPKIIRFNAEDSNNEFATIDVADERASSEQTESADDISTTSALWYKPQLLRVEAIDDDNSEDLSEACDLTFRVHSNDPRYSSHPVRGKVQCDPNTIKVVVFDNDGKYIHCFGDQFGPYGFGMTCSVRQYPERLTIANKTYTNRQPVSTTRKQTKKELDAQLQYDHTGNILPRYARPRRSSQSTQNRNKWTMPRQPIERARMSSSNLVIPLPAKLRAAVCGGYHAVVINANGMVFNAGAGECGQLGHGTTQSQRTLIPWEGVDSEGELRSVIRSASCGKLHTVLVTDNGQVVCTGSNEHGQLGTGMDTTNITKDVQKQDELHVRIPESTLKQRRRSRMMASPLNQPLIYQEARRKHSLDCDTSSSKPVDGKNNDTVAWDDNKVQSKQNSKASDATTSSASRDFVQANAASAATIDGVIPADYSVIPRCVKGLLNKRVIQVACGDNHTLAIAMVSGAHGDTSQVFGWGQGAYGALGKCTSSLQPTPAMILELSNKDPFRVACGSLHSAVLCGMGELYTSGFDDNGRLGRKPSVRGHSTSFRRALVRQNNTDDIHQDGNSETGDNDDMVVFADVSCGGGHTGGLSDCRELWVCGVNSYGQLGLGDTDDRWQFTKVDFLSKHQPCSISFGYFHSCAITTTGTMFVWGCNDQGQLGLGPNVLSQSLPRLQDQLVGLNVVQAQTGRGFTMVMTQLTVEHLALLYQQDEKAFIARKLELDRLQKEELERLKETQRELVLKNRKRKEKKRQLLAFRHAGLLDNSAQTKNRDRNSNQGDNLMQVVKLRQVIRQRAQAEFESLNAKTTKLARTKHYGVRADSNRFQLKSPTPRVPSMSFDAHLKYRRLSRRSLASAFLKIRTKPAAESISGISNDFDDQITRLEESELSNQRKFESSGKETGTRGTEPTVNQGRKSKANVILKSNIGKKVRSITKAYMHTAEDDKVCKSSSSPPKEWLKLQEKLKQLGLN